MPECECKFGVKIEKQWEGMWSIGSCITHSFDETYLFINLIKWTLIIGWFYKEVGKTV